MLSMMLAVGSENETGGGDQAAATDEGTKETTTETTTETTQTAVETDPAPEKEED